MKHRLARARRFAGIGAVVMVIIANLDPDNWHDLAAGDLLYAFGILLGEAGVGSAVGFLLGFFTARRPDPPKFGPSAFD